MAKTLPTTSLNIARILELKLDLPHHTRRKLMAAQNVSFKNIGFAPLFYFLLQNFLIFFDEMLCFISIGYKIVYRLLESLFFIYSMLEPEYSNQFLILTFFWSNWLFFHLSLSDYQGKKTSNTIRIFKSLIL